jgi:hypothetical protein
MQFWLLNTSIITSRVLLLNVSKIGNIFLRQTVDQLFIREISRTLITFWERDVALESDSERSCYTHCVCSLMCFSGST